MSAINKMGAALGLLALAGLASDPKNGSAITGDGGASVGESVADIPPDYMGHYRDAAGACAELDWALLAAIGKVETNHGRSELPGVSSGTNSAGAAGPMQFLGSTFASIRARHPEIGSDVYDPADAIPAAGHYLCDSGLDTGNEYRAIYAYNHAGWYVTKVREQADDYRAAA